MVSRWHISANREALVLYDEARTAIKEALAQTQEPVAWVYPEGLEALKAGKPWTAYGTRQEPNNTALYLSPQPDIAPYAWVTFTPYGDEDDVWYENPEGQLLEGWTYKPLYDTTPPQSKEPEQDPVAIRYDFDGYGYKYMDSGSGSDWQTRVQGEPLYTAPPQRKPLTDEQINEIAEGYIVNYRIPAGCH